MRAPSEPHMAGFPPYYKPTYAWEPLPSSFELRQMSFSHAVLQHASNLYGSHTGSSAQPQPLDCSTHYSPTSNTFHCITCEKVRTTSASRPNHNGSAQSVVKILVERLLVKPPHQGQMKMYMYRKEVSLLCCQPPPLKD